MQHRIVYVAHSKFPFFTDQSHCVDEIETCLSNHCICNTEMYHISNEWQPVFNGILRFLWVCNYENGAKMHINLKKNVLIQKSQNISC